MEEALEEISAELGVEPQQVVEHIKVLPKAREMEDLRAWIDCLLKENTELKMQVADRNDKLKDAEALIVTAFEEKIRAQEKREKAFTMARKFHAFVGYPGDMVTKARLYDECMKKPEVVPARKVLWILIDYNGKVEKLLGELRTLFQYGEQREEVGPSKRRPEPEPMPVPRPEPIPQPASTPAAPSTGRVSAPTLQPGALEDPLESATTPGVPDPMLREPIPDSLNTDDLASLHQWAMERLQETITSTTGSQGPTALVFRITPGSVTRSQRRGLGSVQINLFGETRDDPAAGFHQWIGEQQVKREKQVEEILSSSKSEEDPVSSDSNGSKEEDKDSPPASAHRLVIRSTPKKLVSRPKRKAYRSKGSGPGGSSRKRSKGQK